MDEAPEALRSKRREADRAAEGDVEGEVESDQVSEPGTSAMSGGKGVGDV